ncbi:hypothetical protein SO802_029972 [Lithocarpus litseifolius]|uniref:Stress-associated endoplasmic reticulum protein n=1 Tax=Lithocarpus litseifolius TaxID=425828 RepID=A0AAW2BWU4_9ROSI
MAEPKHIACIENFAAGFLHRIAAASSGASTANAATQEALVEDAVKAKWLGCCRILFVCNSKRVAQTTSKRLSERKVAKFQNNITKRGLVPETTSKKVYDYPVWPIVLGFFVFVVIGSSLFQIIRTAASGGMA